MKALVYEAPETLVFRNVPDPEPRQGEALLQIEHVGICGSDMHAWAGHDARRPAPLILGHEAAGRIIAGPGEGTRVTVNPLVTCGICADCRAGRENLCADRQIISMPPREGAFAEMLAMPPGNLVAVPDHVPTEKAALAEPIACGWHAVRLGAGALERSLGRALAAARCLVFGGGAIGLGAALVLKAKGAGAVTLAETSAARRELIGAMGIDTLDPGAEALPEGIDLIIDGVGIEPTRADATAAIRPGGVIMHIGLGSGAGGLDVRRMTLQEITVIGTYTYTAEDFRETAAAIFEGRLGALDWPECRPLGDGAAAFAEIKAGRLAAPKIILVP